MVGPRFVGVSRFTVLGVWRLRGLGFWGLGLRANVATVCGVLHGFTEGRTVRNFLG